jgi:hypothetical protein
VKSLEEMTDAELAARWMSPELSLFDDSTGAVMPELLAIGAQMAMRLSSHPAQRIADLTGGVVTKNENGMWKLWPNDDLITAYGVWSANFVKVEHFILSLLPDDNRPWQESIYKPQVNVKNGGKYESTSAE